LGQRQNAYDDLITGDELIKAFEESNSENLEIGLSEKVMPPRQAVSLYSRFSEILNIQVRKERNQPQDWEE